LVTAPQPQFETIHPFLDGKGRQGRLLIVLMLVEGGTLRHHQGDWEAWIAFFLEGVECTTTAAVNSAHRLLDLFRSNEIKLLGLGRSGASVRRVFAALRQRPLIGISQLAARAQLSFPTAAKAVDRLVTLGIAREVTGGRRNRVFAYDAYLAILGEGTEPL
jgi:Fic family protein